MVRKNRFLDVCQRLFGGFSDTTFSTGWNYLEIEVKSLYYGACGVQENRIRNQMGNPGLYYSRGKSRVRLRLAFATLIGLF